MARKPGKELPVKTSEDPLRNVTETAAQLRCHPETVREMLRRGDLVGIKYTKLGGRGIWKVRQSSIDRFLKRHEYAA